MRGDYSRYIKHLKQADKRIWAAFFTILAAMLLCFAALAIFSPEDREFAIKMGAFGLLTFAVIHFSGFRYYIKSGQHKD